MEVERLNQNEVLAFRKLVKIFNDVFENGENIGDNDQLMRILTNPDFLVFAIRENGKVLGGVTVYVLHSYYDKKPLAYIYDVAVSPDFQGRGLGKRLIEEVCRYCKINGFESAYVEAESDDLDAVSFYKKTNFSSRMSAIHFTYTFEK